MNPTREAWKPVVGYEGLYEVSNHGNVRSLDRTIHHVGDSRIRTIRGRTLRQFEDRKRYLWVNLSRAGEKQKVGKVHRLVAEAFLSMPEPGQVVRHLDGNVQNNHVENLLWGTPRENSDDMVSMGNSTRGEKAYNAVLTLAIVREARILHATGRHSYRALSIRYGISTGTLASAISRQSWAWLD